MHCVWNSEAFYIRSLFENVQMAKHKNYEHDEKQKFEAFTSDFGYMEQYGQFHPLIRLFGTRLHGIFAYMGHFSRDKRVPCRRNCL